MNIASRHPNITVPGDPRERPHIAAGYAQAAKVARLAGVSLCSVKRIAEEVPVVHVDDAAEREKRRIGRPASLRISGNRS